MPPSGKRKVITKLDDSGEEELEDEDEETGSEKGARNVREFELRSGGIVTLGLTVDLFKLTTDDRKFVFELIDKMTATGISALSDAALNAPRIPRRKRSEERLGPPRTL